MSRCPRRVLLAMLILSACNEVETGSYQGYVEGEFVYVSASVGGTLQELAVTKGQSVEVGAPLFRLDPNPQALQIEENRRRMEQARARAEDISKGSRPSELSAVEARTRKAQLALELARRDHERRQELFAAGNTNAVSAEELDRYRTEVASRQADLDALAAELETARLGGRADAVSAARGEVGVLEAALQQLQWQLDEKQVTAPAAGVVQDTIYRVGEFVPAGRPVVSLLPPGNIKIRFFVPQALLPSLAPGDPVRVHLDGLDESVAAKISFVSPEAEFTPPVIYSKESRTKLVFLIEAVPDADVVARIHPGQPLEVHLD